MPSLPAPGLSTSFFQLLYDMILTSDALGFTSIQTASAASITSITTYRDLF